MFNISSRQGNTDKNYLTTLTYYLLSVRMAMIKQNNKKMKMSHRTPPNTPENVENRNPYSLLVGVQTSTAIMEISVSVSQKN